MLAQMVLIDPQAMAAFRVTLPEQVMAVAEKTRRAYYRPRGRA